MTPSATPTAGCPIRTGALTVLGTGLTLGLTNNDAQAVTITRLELNWPDTPASQKLRNVYLDSAELIDDNDNQPPSLIPDETDWEGPAANRQLNPSATGTLFFHFQEALQPGGYSLIIDFDNGCRLSVSN